MYRYKIKELIDWKISKRRKPLIVLGARQVGKTWLVQEFGKQEYKQTVYVNFEKMKIVRSFKFFCEKYKPAKAIRTSLTDYKQEEWMTNIPLYAINSM